MNTYLVKLGHTIEARFRNVVPHNYSGLPFRLPRGFLEKFEFERLCHHAPAIGALMKNVNVEAKGFKPYALNTLIRFRPHVPAALFDEVMSVAKMVDDDTMDEATQYAAWSSAFAALMEYRDRGMARRLFAASQQATNHAPFVLITGQSHVEGMTKLLGEYGFRVTVFDEGVAAETIIPIVLRRANWLFAYDRTITRKRNADNALEEEERRAKRLKSWRNSRN